MDRGTWWATVHRVTKSCTWLKRPSMQTRDGWIASPTRWTWIWASSRRWWRTKESDEPQSMGLQRVRHDLAAEEQFSTYIRLCHQHYLGDFAQISVEDWPSLNESLDYILSIREKSGISGIQNVKFECSTKYWHNKLLFHLNVEDSYPSLENTLKNKTQTSFRPSLLFQVMLMVQNSFKN